MHAIELSSVHDSAHDEERVVAAMWGCVGYGTIRDRHPEAARNAADAAEIAVHELGNTIESSWAEGLLEDDHAAAWDNDLRDAWDDHVPTPVAFLVMLRRDSVVAARVLAGRHFARMTPQRRRDAYVELRVPSSPSEEFRPFEPGRDAGVDRIAREAFEVGEFGGWAYEWPRGLDVAGEIAHPLPEGVARA